MACLAKDVRKVCLPRLVPRVEEVVRQSGLQPWRAHIRAETEETQPRHEAAEGDELFTRRLVQLPRDLDHKVP